MRRRVPSSSIGALILGSCCVALALTSDGSAGNKEKAQQPDATFYYPFACSLFRAVGANGGNLLLSPHSISLSLAMVRAGAAGETARQVDTLLRLPTDAPNAYRDLAESLADTPRPPVAAEKENNSQGETSSLAESFILDDKAEYSLKIANGVFGQRDLEYVDVFRRSIVEDFAAEFLEVDFAKPAEARSAINGWVEGRTDKRIAEIVPNGLPTKETRMVLADAIFFKASWDEPFPEPETADGPFRVAKGRQVTVMRMRQTEWMNYGESAEAHLLEIPYRRGNTSMLIVLPRAQYGLDTLVKNMTAEKLQRWATAMQRRKVSLELPRFEFSSDLDLSDTLAGMGMPDAFSREKANFSGITTQEPLFIDAVLHKGHVAVDEKGTEAAGVALTMVMLGGVDSEKPIPFVVDHPFLFLIRHMKTGALLFMGRVVDPTAT